MKPLKKTLKQLTVVVMVLMITIPVKAQWGTGISPNDIYNTNTGNVGIGTTGPGAKLHVYSNGSNQIRSEGGTGMYGYFRAQSGTTYWDLATRDSDYGGAFQIRSQGGSPQVVVNPSGNVGIGATVPAAKLHTFSNLGNYQDFRVSYKDAGISGLGLSATEGVSFRTDGAGGTTYIDLSISGSNSQNAVAIHAWKTIAGAGSEANLVLQPYVGGNVGIGTTNPEGKIDVIGTITGGISNGSMHLIPNSISNGNITIGAKGVGGGLHLNFAGIAQNGGITIYDGGTTAIGAWKSNGNVGIGTTVPYTALHVYGQETNQWSIAKFQRPDPGLNKALYIRSYGDQAALVSQQDLTFYTGANDNSGGIEVMRLKNSYVGIGTTSPNTKLHVFEGEFLLDQTDATQNHADLFYIKGLNINNPSSLANTAIGLKFISGILGGASSGIYGKAIGADNMNLHFWTETVAGRSDKMVITSNGYVGIGTQIPSQVLTVNGKILAEEVQVVVDVPDYVFAKEYKLKTLAEVSKFIDEHKHLPEVPSEKEVLDNCGQVSLGEMNMTLLKKIEELTLYAIEQENNINEQNEVIKELIIQNETILKRVTELEKQ